ncbi:MAG: ATP-binding protein [Gemmataceae bacterium]
MPTNADLRVLVVDDDPDTRSNLCDILELDNFQVETAGTVAEVMRRGDWDRLSAIILDRRLPDGNAEDLLPRLRQLAPEAAILIVTGYADLQGVIAALRQGAADYILKPINADALRASLARFAALKRAQERALQAERLAVIGQMMAGLAHESGNALARSQACLEMLAMEVEDRPAALDLIGRIQKAQNHLQQLYEEVRNYAAPLKLQRQPHSLRSIWRQAWSSLADRRLGRAATLREESENVDLVYPVDAFRLEQVFRNILDNALAACKDPVEISVSCSMAALDGQPALRIAVRDKGPGLSAEQRQRLFEPFFTTKTKGTGLGMAIAERIVEAHGGRIAAGTPAGPGAEIQLLLPRGNS